MDNNDKTMLGMMESLLLEIKDVKGELQQARLEIQQQNMLINQMRKDIIGLRASNALLSGQYQVEGQTKNYIEEQNYQAISAVGTEAKFNSPFKNR